MHCLGLLLKQESSCSSQLSHCLTFHASFMFHYCECFYNGVLTVTKCFYYIRFYSVGSRHSEVGLGRYWHRVSNSNRYSVVSNSIEYRPILSLYSVSMPSNNQFMTSANFFLYRNTLLIAGT